MQSLRVAAVSMNAAFDRLEKILDDGDAWCEPLGRLRLADKRTTE